MSFSHLYQDPQVVAGFHPRRVLQSGANGLNELGLYRLAQAQWVLFVEADEDNYARVVNKLQSRTWSFEYRTLHRVLSQQAQAAQLHRYTLDPTHSLHPATAILHLRERDVVPVTTTTLDLLLPHHGSWDTLMLDCQGSENDVLRGGTQTLTQVQHLFVEVWKPGQEGYAGSGDIRHTDQILQKHGIERLKVYWPSPRCAWGYAYYQRRKGRHYGSRK